MLVAGQGAAVTESYKGYASAAATTLSLPSHTTGDILVMCAINFDAPPTIGTTPAGWTELKRVTFSYYTTGILAYKVAESGGETSGTWTDAEGLLCACYRGFSGVGDSSDESASSGTAWPALTMEVSDGSSWAVGITGFTSVTTGYTNPPTGMTYRGILSSGNNHIVLCDTAGGVASWSRRITSNNCTACQSFTVELKA